MAIFDLYSKRKKQASGKKPDVYTYDKLPQSLKVQILHVMDEVIGAPYLDHFGRVSSIANFYQEIIKVFRHEAGVFRLSDETTNPRDAIYAYPELVQYFLASGSIDDELDVVELVCRCVENLPQGDPEKAREAIHEINVRFDEHGVGYQYSDGVIIRRDSEFVHNVVVKPALLVLRNKIYASAQQEFLNAYDHYKDGKMSECLVDTCKAFESTMKIICTKRKWAHAPTMPASKLIKVCMDNDLIPSYWQAHFANLQGLLEASIPTARNKQGGHGAGVSPPHNPPRELVAYVLHMTASTILFLTEAEKALP